MERTSERWGERVPACWQPAPEAEPQGPKVAHCGGTGVCVVLGPFACSPLAPACSNMTRPSLHCSAGTHQATQLWPNGPRKKTSLLCSSVCLSFLCLVTNPLRSSHIFYLPCGACLTFTIESRPWNFSLFVWILEFWEFAFFKAPTTSEGEVWWWYLDASCSEP